MRVVSGGVCTEAVVCLEAGHKTSAMRMRRHWLSAARRRRDMIVYVPVRQFRSALNPEFNFVARSPGMPARFHVDSRDHTARRTRRLLTYK